MALHGNLIEDVQLVGRPKHNCSCLTGMHSRTLGLLNQLLLHFNASQICTNYAKLNKINSKVSNSETPKLKTRLKHPPNHKVTTSFVALTPFLYVLMAS